MRGLLLIAMMAVADPLMAAHADTLQTLDASQVATGKLDACFDRNFDPASDAPGRGDSSRNRLLRACSAEWNAAAKACHDNTGNPLAACRKQTGTLADDYLSLKNAGIH